MTPALDPHQVQRALCCMLLDPDYAARVRGDAPLPELDPPARALLRALDPRALQTDRFRRARAVQVILEEHPVTAAILGVPAIDRYFSSAELRAAIFERGSMVLSFGTWLGDKALGIGRLEAAMARARRPDRPRPPALAAAGALQTAPHIVPLITPEGTLRWYQRARERLGPAPLEALAALERPWPQRPPRSGHEHLLVEAAADGSMSLGTASPELVRLLLHAETPRPPADLAAEAARLGADPGDVDDLLAGLVADGLLVAAP